MVRVRVPALICLLLSLLLSISKGKTHLHFSSYNFIVVPKPSFVTLFFMFHFIIITIFVGRPKPSVEDLEVSFSPIPPPLVYEMDETIREVEVCDRTGTDHDEEDDQSCSTVDGYDVIQESTIDDEEEVSGGYVEDNEDGDVFDAEGDQDSEDEEYDNELEKKIEGFMEKVYQRKEGRVPQRQVSLYHC
ncbi:TRANSMEMBRANE PROTEIN [Salix viminalis]|uniref:TRANSMEMBRANE PROTEIN n=1 Tax=Salix viminalis TaxID=40686 RepID=A0A9Q0NT98_SALVM|nr:TRANSMEMBRANE PROTEIN [Salix viminalis]